MSNMKKQCEIGILHDALSLFDTYAAWASSAIINHRLCPDKRRYLALCALLANEPDEVVEVADAALNALTFGMPLPPFSSPIDEAQWWSERASPYELEACVTHCFLRLSKARQRDFAQYAMRRATNG